MPSRIVCTSHGVSSGLASSTRAATPATWGAAMDVPWIDRYPVWSPRARGHALQMALPGAATSTYGRRFEKSVTSRPLSTAATAITLGSMAGIPYGLPRCWSLPAEATTTTPARTAASTAGRKKAWVRMPLSGVWRPTPRLMFITRAPCATAKSIASTMS